MNSVSTITVKDIDSVARYASQYVNGEEITLMTKDGTKYFTDGKGGYFLLSASQSNGDIPEEPIENPFIDKLKILAENVEVLKLFSKDEEGNLLFNGVKIGGNVSASGSNQEITLSQFNELKEEVLLVKGNVQTLTNDMNAVKENNETLETSISETATKESLEAVKADVETAKENISTLETSINDKVSSEALGTLRTEVNGIKDNVDKLLRHGHDEEGNILLTI